jgi:hypothetical protein
MFLDANLQVCADQAVTADAASENTIDFGNTTPKRKMGVGEPMGYGIFINAIGTNTGSAKLLAVQSAAADLGSPQTVGQVDLAAADIAVGKAYFVPVSPGQAPALRYGGLFFDITGTVDFTVDAFLMPQSMFSQLALPYAKNYTIS